MAVSNNPVSVFSDSKNHYQILDGLRGVAAVMVLLFHLCEAFTFGNRYAQIINHGYLAVDFFFLLSGFVIGYAYDDRWGKMTLGSFFKRRLIRLHPMIIMGMIIGAIAFYFSASPTLFPGISSVPVWKLLLITAIGCTLIPVPVQFDIRGWDEMHPVDAPAWSLLFEYVANVMYALFVRKFSNTLLAIFVFLAGAALIHLTVFGPNGDVIGGWSLEPTHMRIGFTRLLYPFFAGLLLSRICKPGQIANAFLWTSVMVIIVLSIPRVGGPEMNWMNGLYESFVIIVLFPLIVYMGASGTVQGKFAGKLCQFFGDISYPLYIIHYPLIYIYTAWVTDNKLSMADAWPMALVVLLASVAIAYGSLKLYDIPVRKWLVKHFM
ncbi:MAG: acyltransferase family protein [Mangrovibacterium sp.]